MNQQEKDEIIKLFENFLLSFNSKNSKTKRTEDEGSSGHTNIIFDLLKMNGNNRSKIFSQSATYLEPTTRESLFSQGLIQSIASEDGEKYALSLMGIAQCVVLEKGIPLDQQYASFLKRADREYNKSEPPQLDWRERLATLSLILLASTSNSSALQLTNNQNQTVLMDVFQEVLACLKKYHLAENKDEIKASSRGENPVAGHMARLDFLPRKTSHYYIGKDYVYYFNIESDQIIDPNKLYFLMKRCFEGYDDTCNYSEMYKELSRISQKYSTRFLGRNVNPIAVLSILSKLKEFLESDIYQLKAK